MKIATNHLKKLCRIILLTTEAKGIKEVNVNLDYYWTLSTLDAINLGNKEPKIMVGSFIDDYDSLKKVSTDQNPLSSIDFDRLGNVLKVVGYAISKNDNISGWNITIDHLKKMCEKIWSVTIESGFREFYFNIGQYQYLNQTEAYDMDNQTQHVIFRSFDEDWIPLQKILSGQTPATITDFECLGNIVKATGYVISNTKDRVLLDLR